jgi:hypothetical protein
LPFHDDEDEEDEPSSLCASSSSEDEEEDQEDQEEEEEEEDSLSKRVFSPLLYFYDSNKTLSEKEEEEEEEKGRRRTRPTRRENGRSFYDKNNISRLPRLWCTCEGNSSKENAASFRVVVLTTDGKTSDEMRWRKYGQKFVKGSKYPRSYYKCTSISNMNIQKHVEEVDDNGGQKILVTFHTQSLDFAKDLEREYPAAL